VVSTREAWPACPASVDRFDIVAGVNVLDELLTGVNVLELLLPAAATPQWSLPIEWIPLRSLPTFTPAVNLSATW